MLSKLSKILIVLLLASSFSCQKEDFTINNLFEGKIVVLGHGGMGIGQTYPMDSYESIMKCISIGANGSEIDVQLSKDNILVAYHNQDLSDKTNLKGLVNNLNWKEIKKGYYTSTPYLNYSILSLDDLFSNIKNLHKYKFTFDCKLYKDKNPSFQDNYVDAIEKIIAKYNLYENVYIESQSLQFLKKLQNKNKLFKLFIYPSSFEKGLEIAINNNLYGITISTEIITKEQIEIAHKNNIYVAVWNTHSRNKNIEAIKKNPDFIQTDRVQHLVNMEVQ